MENAATILIVDDELGGRKTLEALLKPEGYRLAFASSGAEALAKAAELVPDVILLDVMMPGMDGFEVCRRLRADSQLSEAPVIMVTALDDRDSRLRGLEVGADDFVSKPFDRAELRVRVRTVTRLNRYRRLVSERTKFEWVVEHADDGYLVVSENDAVLYTNPRARLYLGLAAGAGAPLAETFLELVRKQYHCEPQAAWETWPKPPTTDPSSPRYLVLPESSNRGAVWLQVDQLDVLSGAGSGWLIRLRDVSTRMAWQRDTMSFHTVVSHKLRTPLSNMIGGLELLARHASGLSADEVVEFSDMALRNARRLHADVEDVLRYVGISGRARPGAGFILSQLQPLLAEISARLELASVMVAGQESVGDARVALAPQAVELIFWEILENAKKFHPRQSPNVKVVVSLVGDSAAGPRQKATLRVYDDGLTLPPAQLDRVWTPYYQVEKMFTGEIAGIGLGLPMVASLVWGVGGTCRIYNREDGPGVVVELVLPLAE